MKRKYLLWIVPGIVIGLSSCTINPPPDPLHVASPLDPSKAYANWRWIGIKRDPDAPDCPKIAGWEKEKPLFGENDPTQPGPDGYRADAPGSQALKELKELKRFCVYEVPKKGKKSTPLSPPPMSKQIVRFDRDRAALAPAADPSLETKVRKTLSAHFLWQVGPLEALPTLDESPGVRLAFLDTQPDGEDVPMKSGRSRHGYTLAHIARNLVCDPGSQDLCAAKITTRLAVRVVRFNSQDREHTQLDEDGPDEEGRNGGFVGTLGDLAQAIKNEVDAWQRGSDRERRLVLNLSVAWDGDLFGGLHEKRVCDMPADVQAVYSALKYAHDSGVLVLAAAGNRQYGPYPDPRTGPLLPAAWESRRIEHCCDKQRETPLVYAVGGVQSEGWPLANARVGGLPRRVAYADHAVVNPLNPDEPTAVYTGSSVATAVVSSIAAVVWNAYPEYDAHELMKILDASGDVRPFPASFWFSPGPDASQAPQVHRLSLCSALAAAPCAPDFTESCLARARARCERTLERPRLSDLLIKSTPGDPPALELVNVKPPCLATQMLCPSGSSSPPLCPSDRFFDITSQPWLFSQPGDTPCPNCLIVPPPPNIEPLGIALAAHRSSSPTLVSYTLHGVIRGDWPPGHCLSSATLDIERFDPPDSATRRISVDFGRSYCQPGEPFVQKIWIPSDIQLDERTTVTLSFVTQETGTSAQSPVLVAH